MFTQQYRKDMQAEVKVSPQELTALAASQWRVMSAADREPFVKASLAERAQVDGQYRAWKVSAKRLFFPVSRFACQEANPDVPTGYSKDKRARAELPSRSACTQCPAPGRMAKRARGKRRRMRAWCAGRM